MKSTLRNLPIATLLCLLALSRAYAADAVPHSSVPPFVAGVLFVATMAGLVVLGFRRNSGMLCDPVPAGQTYTPPFSLARVQMAWWYAIIVWSYLFIWGTTGSAPPLSRTLLCLAGISGATGATSVMISGTQNTQFPAREGFFADLLTDKNGMTLHRFQMLSMTVILGVIFIVNVVSQGALPADYDGTMLGLMGISSGTYLGFKIPEQQ